MTRKRKFSVSTVLSLPSSISKRQAADSRKALQSLHLSPGNSSSLTSKSLTAADKPKLRHNVDKALLTSQTSNPAAASSLTTNSLIAADKPKLRHNVDKALLTSRTSNPAAASSLTTKFLTAADKPKLPHIVDTAQLRTSNPVAASPQKENLSPNRALRVAMLKCQFADTILKAHEKLHKPVHITEKQQLKEGRTRFNVQAKAAETNCKTQREQQRRTARLAVEKIEKSVQLYENLGFLDDDKNLGYSGFNDDVAGYHALENPLEKLGLFLKKDDMDDEEMENCLLSNMKEDIVKKEKIIKLFGSVIKISLST